MPIKQVTFPCDIGDTVWFIAKHNHTVQRSQVKSIFITRRDVKYKLRCGKNCVFGRDMFLSEQEALERIAKAIAINKDNPTISINQALNKLTCIAPEEPPKGELRYSKKQGKWIRIEKPQNGNPADNS